VSDDRPAAPPGPVTVTVTMTPDGQLHVNHPESIVLACGMIEMAKALMLAKVTRNAQEAPHPLLLARPIAFPGRM
jgi:hypothetical protein